MRKRLLIEEDIDELEDFRKILPLNKRKLDHNDVVFYNSEGKDFSDIIEVTPHGLLFHFNDLEEFLKFFFQETYQERGVSPYQAKPNNGDGAHGQIEPKERQKDFALP
jgi:hypothetical protein